MGQAQQRVENSITRQKWAGGMEGGEKEDTEETEPPSHSQARNARESSRGFFFVPNEAAAHGV